MVQLRKERAALEREYRYAAGCAGKVDYWRAPVGPHRNGYLGGDINRYDDPIAMARIERMNPRIQRVGPDGGEAAFEMSIAQLSNMRDQLKAHEASQYRVYEEENRLRENILSSKTRRMGEAF